MVFYSPDGKPTNTPFTPPKKRFGCLPILFLLGAVVVGSIAMNAITSDADTSAAPDTTSATASNEASESLTAESPAPEAPAEDAPTIYAIGQSVTSAKFEYVVTDFNCGIPSVGEHEITREVAKGQFCQLSITAKNIAKQAEKLDFDDFKLMSGDIEYSTDFWINIKSASGSESGGFLDEINPGLQVNGNIFFDVPLEVIPDRAVVQDSRNSEPSTISLQK